MAKAKRALEISTIGDAFNSLCGMAFPVVEFSREGYKIRKVFG